MMVIKMVTLIKMVPLFLLVVLGFRGAKLSNLRMDHLPSFQSLGEISLVLFFAFAGGETALNIGGEMKNPSRTAPLGILYGMTATIVIFCLIQLAAQGVLGAELANYREAPLAALADKLIGPVGTTVIIAASLIAIFGILNSLPLAFPRVMLAGAEDNLLPRYLAKIHPRFSTPANAIITFSGISFLVAVSGGFRQLAIIVSASLLLLYLGVVLATIKFRFKKNIDRSGTFKIPGGLTIPIAALVALSLFIVQLQLKEIIGIAIFISFLSIIYLFKTLSTKRINKLTVPEA
jgi:basic amino acid/polyamine antiporter, APA family